jgi:YidC/Oxa1 family membrane protein insertase
MSLNTQKVTDFLRSFLIWFAIFYLMMWALQSFLGDKEDAQAPTESGVQIKPLDLTPVIGHKLNLQIENQLDRSIVFFSPCGDPQNLIVSGLLNGEKLAISDATFAECEKSLIPDFSLAPGEQILFSLPEFNHQFFGEAGRYVLDFRFTDEAGAVISAESATIEYESPGLFRQLFRAVIIKPLFNLLVFLIEVMPGHSLGWAVILLTILVRILLFLPNQKAMKSQRKMQQLQPKIEALRKAHGDNQQMLAMKTMELYKTEKINPMSSCLPMLLQMPVLIGIYFVVRDGLSEHLRFLLYDFHQGADLTQVDTYFFGLHLEQPNLLVLPFLVGAAQYIAVKLSLIASKKKNNAAPAEGMAAQMEQMQKVMLYVLPVMIAIFTATFPAAVGVYWLTSTIFGIFQQKLVNYQLDKHPEVRRKIS